MLARTERAALEKAVARHAPRLRVVDGPREELIEAWSFGEAQSPPPVALPPILPRRLLGSAAAHLQARRRAPRG